ncbi:MAG: 50S ribosomal protein L4 [Simkaniaceae bacterium]|nr:50S ribosomal protein L4 [Candidatus Sacchlamyda saccharinae]
MATLKKYDLKGKASGEVSIEDAVLTTEVNGQMIKDYLVAIRANQRQWSASTQTRAEVSKTKRKPFKQKGTGNARQGFLGAPQFKGGGRVHAPRPKFDQHVRINRKEKRLAIRHLLSEKIQGEKAHVLDYKALKAPETKALANFMKSLELQGKRVLFLAENGDYSTLHKSLRNIPRAEFLFLPNVSGYDLAVCHELVILDSAVEQLKETLGGKK